MDGTGHNPADELRRIIAEGRISEEALRAITGIAGERLADFLDRSVAGLSAKAPVLSGDETTRLSVLGSQLVQGLEIDDDERLRGILEGLTIEFKLTPQNIALLTATNLEDVETCLRDPGTVPSERKYSLGLRVSYLNLAIANARRN
jgi:hypothetical protein